MPDAKNKNKPSCVKAIIAQTSDLYVYDVYSMIHMSDVFMPISYVYL